MAKRRKTLKEALLTEVFDGLEEYYPALSTTAARRFIASKVMLRETGNVQLDYENLRDQVEAVIKTVESFKWRKRWLIDE